MPRFVVLEHETPTGSARPLHWDFMLESGDALRTWALAEEPAAEREIAAEVLADHRLAYLDYEGPISGNRGYVTQWDRGECTIEQATSEVLRLAVVGEKLIGEVVILALPSDARKATFRWHSPTSAP